MIDQWLSGAMVFAGFLAGMAINTRTFVFPGGKRIVYLSMMPWTRAQRVLYLSVGSVSVLGAIVTARTASEHVAEAKRLDAVTTLQHQQIDRQQACNNQMTAAINARATITAQDATNLQNLLLGVGTLVQSTPSQTADARKRFQTLFAVYMQVQAANNKQRAANPLPSPSCGK